MLARYGSGPRHGWGPGAADRVQPPRQRLRMDTRRRTHRSRPQRHERDNLDLGGRLGAGYRAGGARADFPPVLVACGRRDGPRAPDRARARAGARRRAHARVTARKGVPLRAAVTGLAEDGLGAGVRALDGVDGRGALGSLVQRALDAVEHALHPVEALLDAAPA